MTRFVLAACCTALFAASASAQHTAADSAAAVAVVDRFNAALIAGDSAQAVAQLASDAVVLESGHIQTRAEYLGGHLAADMKASQGSKGQRTMMQVTLIGDAAYVVSRTLTPGTGPQGDMTSESVELMVVTRTNGTWAIRAVHWSSRRRRA